MTAKFCRRVYAGRKASAREIARIRPGGRGKTRLAARVARELIGDFPDGVWLIDLAPLSDPNHVAQRLAALVEIREQLDRPTESSLTTYLQSRRTLLVFDNCKHLVDASARPAKSRRLIDFRPTYDIFRMIDDALAQARSTTIKGMSPFVRAW